MGDYVAPQFKLEAFHCPLCHVFAHQIWRQCYIANNVATSCYVAKCSHCKNHSFWVDQLRVFPPGSNAPQPNDDLPQDVVADYQEASMIAALSPRGAGALLRLAIQKLCKHLGQPGDNINDDIAALVKKGLSPTVQQALDSVRVIGNNCVHPGELDIRDNPETVQQLFRLVNFIAQTMITDPKEIQKIYDALPDSSRNAIDRRDQSAT